MCFLMAVTVKMRSVDERTVFALLLLTGLIITYHRTYDFFVLTAAYPGVEVLAEKLGDRPGAAFRVAYLLLLLYVFFGLRVFSESTPSMLAAAVIYYAFVIAYLIFMITDWSKGTRTGKGDNNG